MNHPTCQAGPYKTARLTFQFVPINTASIRLEFISFVVYLISTLLSAPQPNGFLDLQPLSPFNEIKSAKHIIEMNLCRLLLTCWVCRSFVEDFSFIRWDFKETIVDLHPFAFTSRLLVVGVQVGFQSAPSSQ